MQCHIIVMTEMKYETYIGLRNDITNSYHCTDTSQDINCLNNVFQTGHNLTSQGILKVTIDHYYENVQVVLNLKSSILHVYAYVLLRQ